MPELLLEIVDAKETDEGYYEGWAIVGGEGVRDYTDKYGVKMYAPASELFAPDTMASASLLPITPRHPAKDVTAENWNELSIGVTGEKPERRGNSLAMYIKVTAAWAIEEIRRLKEAGLAIKFSLGYKILPDKTAGSWMGKVYQWIMRHIRYNHLALLLDPRDIPRHAETGEINDSLNDSGELLLMMDSFSPTKPLEGKKVKKKLPGSGVEIEIEDADVRHFDNFVTEHSNQATELATKKGEVKQLERDLKKAGTSVADSVVDKAVGDRLELALEAFSLLDSVDVKELAKMSPLEIKEEVLIADGYTEDELKTLKTEEGDQYAATVGGIYKRIVRQAGDRESEIINDAASRASLGGSDTSRTTTRGGRKVLKDTKVVEARKRAAERGSKTSKGARA